MSVKNLLLLYMVVSVHIWYAECASEDAVVQIKFSLRESRLPAVITYIINNSYVEYDISVYDLLELSKFDRYSMADTHAFFERADIPLDTVYTIDSLELLLNSVQLEFRDFYSSLREKLGLTNEHIIEIFSALEIDQQRFLLADFLKQDIYPILREGNYDQEHVARAFETISKSRSQVFDNAKGVVLEQSLTLDTGYFVRMLNAQGFDRKGAAKLWKLLELGTRDVYESVKFRLILANISAELNQNINLGVAVSESRIAVQENLYRQFAEDYDRESVYTQLGTGEEVELKVLRFLGPNVVELNLTSNVTSWAFRTDSVNYTEVDCYYFTLVDGNLVSKRLEMEEDSIEITGYKVHGVVFNQGSPLFCGDLLYGLAREEIDDMIIFDHFYPEGEEVKPASHASPNPLPQSTAFYVLIAFCCKFVKSVW